MEQWLRENDHQLNHWEWRHHGATWWPYLVRTRPRNDDSKPKPNHYPSAWKRTLVPFAPRLLWNCFNKGFLRANVSPQSSFALGWVRPFGRRFWDQTVRFERVGETHKEPNWNIEKKFQMPFTPKQIKKERNRKVNQNNLDNVDS